MLHIRSRPSTASVANIFSAAAHSWIGSACGEATQIPSLKLQDNVIGNDFRAFPLTAVKLKVSIFTGACGGNLPSAAVSLATLSMSSCLLGRLRHGR